MDNTPLKSFLYELMRDHLPCADVENIVRNVEVEKYHYPVHFENIDLANYAEKLANRILEEPKFNDE